MLSISRFYRPEKDKDEIASENSKMKKNRSHFLKSVSLLHIVAFEERCTSDYPIACAVTFIPIQCSFDATALISPNYLLRWYRC